MIYTRMLVLKYLHIIGKLFPFPQHIANFFFEIAFPIDIKLSENILSFLETLNESAKNSPL